MSYSILPVAKDVVSVIIGGVVNNSINMYIQCMYTLYSLAPTHTLSLSLPSFLNHTLCSELFGDINTGINFDKYEDIPVEATGEGCPKNVTNFDECDFDEITLNNIKVSVCVYVVYVYISSSHLV